MAKVSTRERGGAPLFLIAALVLSAGVGVGVYFVLHDHARASSADLASAERDPPVPTKVTPAAVEDAAVQPPIITEHLPEIPHPPPAPTVSAPEVVGSLDTPTVERVVQKRMRSLQRCYEDQLADRPTLAGTIRVSFAVSGSGSVASVSAVGFDKTVASCVAGVIRRTAFPAPPDGEVVNVVYPLAFGVPQIE